MEQLDHFYGYFNVILGILMILIGFRIYKPFKGEKGEAVYRKFKDLYRYGGIGMLIWGLTKIFAN